MRLFILLLIITSVSTVEARPLYEKLLDKKYSFSALNMFFKETSTKNISSDQLEKLEEILESTGIEVAEDYSARILELYRTPSIYFVLARKALLGADHNRALAMADKIPSHHRLYPEAQHIRAQVFSTQNNLEAELEAYLACAAGAQKRINKEEERYYRTLTEVCAANRARRVFREGNHKLALDQLNKFPKDTYKWPYLLYERAWLYFHKGDYNRTLGLLMTYKSPLMDTYFFPEAEYLMALSYFKLCLYQDSTLIINQYYQTYRPRYTALEQVLRENKNTKDFFFNMLFKQDKELKNHTEFVRQIVIRMKKQNRFATGFKQIKQLNAEIKRVQTAEKVQVQSLLLSHLVAVRSNLVAKLDNYAKLEIFSFLETVRYFSNELFKMNLEIISRKKDLIYENKALVANRSRGDYSNVKRDRFEYFWKFEGAFWADELGDYSLGLKSNCETVSRGKKK